MTEEGLQPLRTDRQPLAARAQQYLLGLIENGTYQPGEQLPSQADLATQLGISRPTLREALLNLEQEGLIVRKHGVGTFVAPGSGRRLESGLERLESVLELAARHGLVTDFAELEVEERQAGEEEAAPLQVDEGTPVTEVRRVIVVDGTPVAYMVDLLTSSHLPASCIDDTFKGSVLDLLRCNPDLGLAGAVAEIVALDAAGFLVDKLKVKPGQAILLLEETLFDVENRPVGFSRNYFIPDFFRFHVVRR
ncbi:MAG TPA: GntR family transcriptional regulator [Anaerolineae bacterium]|nr:GntR family transcriptional regulator [Anaerolineae bacterium]